MVNITLSVNMPIYGIDDDYECPKEEEDDCAGTDR